MAGCCRNSGPPATIAGLIEAGTNVTVTGSGTLADPYVISAADEGIPPAITGLIEAGTNVVLSGTGTTTDPYVLVSNATGLVTAGTNVTVTGAGTVASPYVVNSAIPARGAPVALTITAPVTGSGNVTRNPDTSMTLDGAVIIAGAVAGGADTPVATLPGGYMPGVATDFAGVGIGSATGNPIAVRVTVEPGGTVTVRTPAIGGGDTLTVELDALTYWP